MVPKSVETAVKELLDRLDEYLAGRGQSREALLSACRRMGGEAAAREYGLGAEQKADLFLALQLQAEQALEEIRTQAANQLSDEEIDAEVLAAREEGSRLHSR